MLRSSYNTRNENLLYPHTFTKSANNCVRHAASKLVKISDPLKKVSTH